MYTLLETVDTYKHYTVEVRPVTIYSGCIRFDIFSLNVIVNDLMTEHFHRLQINV